MQAPKPKGDSVAGSAGEKSEQDEKCGGADGSGDGPPVNGLGSESKSLRDLSLGAHESGENPDTLANEGLGFCCCCLAGVT